jgi:hypothetical protein
MSFLEPVIVYVPILAIAFFIALPLISRETTLRSISKKHRDLNYGFLTSTLQKRFRREKILIGFLWIGLIFGPFLFYLELYYFWESRWMFWSLFYGYAVYAGSPVYIGVDILAYFRLTLTGIDLITLPIFTLMSAVRFLFVRDIFRFQSGIIKRSRLISVAILGELLPSAVLTLISLIFYPPGISAPIFVPIPILPIIGFLFIRLSKVVPIKEELWPDYEHRMWYESRPIQIPYTPGLKEETIKVPVSYLLVSQLRKRLSNHPD